MAMTVRPRRSILYMPGSNPRAMEKGKTLPADGLILDLEDAVAPDAKPLARAQVAEALAAGGYGRRELVVRVNGLDTPWGRDDLAAVARTGADAVLLPKVERPEQVREAEALLEEGGAPAGMAIWCMVETPLGVLRAAEVAGASARLGAFVMGTSDLAKDLRARHVPGRAPLLPALGLALLAARAHGLAALDGVHLDLEDEEGFRESCRQGRDLGFDGKTLIHPRSIAAANEAFGPAADEVAGARRIIEAYREAASRGQGVVVVEGRLVEALHVEEARRIVALADAIAAAGSAG